MNATSLLPLVDSGNFHELFIRKLFWNNPDRHQPLTVTVEGVDYTLTQVAGFKGLRVWVCDQAPSRKIQREIDLEVGKDSAERLIIFCDSDHQDWRWPRRAQTGGVNAKLMMHRHVIGEHDQHLDQQLHAIQIDLNQDTSLIELLTRMRSAFDVESETESAKAARLMGTLYNDLESSGVRDNDATLLLARLLFLLFGDDTNMWGPGISDLFMTYVDRYTTDENLNEKLREVFRIADTPTDDRGNRPGIPADHPLALLPYINGGLFSEPLDLPSLTGGFRSALLDAAAFDWSLISPAIFGSMFQTVKDRVARRAMGEHYTTETNILRTIGPLFLDEYAERLERAWDDKGQLTRLLDDLKAIRVLDPACGCGNFLVVSYRELRAIELQALIRRRDLDLADGKISSSRGNLAQTTNDVTQYVGVTIDHFYGIEIEEWPARIAETAMLLVDHLANQRMEEEFGVAPHRLPIKLAPTIVHGNALRTDWTEVVPPSEDVVIVGNPPFIGQYTKTPQQAQDTRDVWGSLWNGYLDYVTCWYAKAIGYYGSINGKWGFVSTNSICQGEATEPLWRPILDAGWRCRFAHRSFRWTTEAANGAAVHVSILGFDRASQPKPVLWTYGEDGRGEQVEHPCNRINPYLIADAPMILVSGRTSPMSDLLPEVVYGNKPTDDGNFFLEGNDLDLAQTDPVAATYIRRFIGARELLHNIDRRCLWLAGTTEEERASSELVSERVEAVREFRLKSKKAATNRKAATAWLFDEIRQPNVSYLVIPRHSSETRQFVPTAHVNADVISGDANFIAEDPDGFAFAIISSSMFITWQKAIGGRLESRLRFSNTLTWNTFPLPAITHEQRQSIIAGGQKVLDARALHAERSLAEHYDPASMAPELLAAHATLDMAVDRAMGAKNGCADNDERLKLLFKLYAKMTGQEEDPVLF